MKPRVIVILIVFALVAGGLFLFSHSHPVELASAPQPKKTKFETFATSRPVGTFPRPIAPVHASVREFKAKLGESFKFQYDQNGHLASVQTEGGKNQRAHADFDPQDPQKVIARAREILALAEGLIGVDARAPLQNPLAKGTAFGAGVSFHEAIGGIPVAPNGSVSIDLGAQGELKGLYSDYRPPVDVTNQFTMAPDDAKQRAIAAVNALPTGLRVEGGIQVVWFYGTDHGVEGRDAYEFWVHGVEVAVDAATGQILSQRDRRQR